MTTVQLDARPAPPPSRAQLVLRYATIAACLPYVALKIAWICGSRIGGAPAEMSSSTYVAANLITGALDLVTIGLVVALTSRRGHRIPAWLLLVPSWVGTGLLAPIALGVPTGFLVQLIVGGSAMPTENELHGWIFVVVYGGFTLQAVLLGAAFTLHARARWPELTKLRSKDLQPGLTGPIQRLFGTSAAVGAVGYGVARLVWAASGGRFGGDPSAVETAAQQVIWTVQGLLALVAAGGVLALVYRWGNGRLWLPVVLTWIGAGYIFSSGFFGGSPTPTLGFVHLLGAVIGLLMGIAALLLLMENHLQLIRPAGPQSRSAAERTPAEHPVLTAGSVATGGL